MDPWIIKHFLKHIKSGGDKIVKKQHRGIVEGNPQVVNSWNRNKTVNPELFGVELAFRQKLLSILVFAGQAKKNGQKREWGSIK